MNALCNKPFQDGGGDTAYTGATVKDGKVCVFTQIQVMGNISISYYVERQKMRLLTEVSENQYLMNQLLLENLMMLKPIPKLSHNY